MVDYRHAALLEPALAGRQVTALADVSGVDRNTPYVQWLERVSAVMPADERASIRIAADELPDWEREAWADLAPSAALMVPLAPPDGEPVAWLWVARGEDWGAGERSLLEHLGEVYGHALNAAAPRRAGGGVRRWLHNRVLWIVAVVILAAVLAIPVRLSALAPAQIVALHPTIVAAPMDGVVQEVLVEPNARVEAGQPLVRFEDLEARNRLEVAQQALKVAQARYRKTRQQAFADLESRASLAPLQAEVDLRRIELEFARKKLEKIVLEADHAGIAIFDDRQRWAGKPVQTGERIMQLADPDARELRVRLPVKDAIVLKPGAPLELFLNAHPLDPLAGEVARMAYKPVVTARNRLVYLVTARLNEQRPYLRIGLRGTVRISGPRVPLAYYLFRRPLTALRQMLGV